MITLANIQQASAQEIFNQAYIHLLTQNSKSMLTRDDDKAPFCAYRGANNTKCVAGCFISDDEYQPWFEGLFWMDLENAHHVPVIAHNDLISQLQCIHDGVDVIAWKPELEFLAQERGLTLPYFPN